MVARRRRTHRAKRTRELIRRCHPRRVLLILILVVMSWINLGLNSSNERDEIDLVFQEDTIHSASLTHILD